MAEEFNKTVLVGMVTDKDMKSTSIDLDQPVIGFEIVNLEKSSLVYVPLKVFLAENAYARSANGMNPGEIFQISGPIHYSESDDYTGIYIEASKIARIFDKKAIPSLIRGRMELLNWSESNMTVFRGSVEEASNGIATIKVYRDHLMRGSLTKYDLIPIKTEQKLKKGNDVVCMGDIYDGYVQVKSLQVK